MMLKKKDSQRLLIYVFLILSFSNTIKPTYAFVPKVYEPSKRELNLKAIGIGQTAQQLLYFGQVEKANQLTLLAIQLDPSNDKLWGLLAESQIRLNKYNLARESLKKAKTINPKEARYWFKEASIEFNENKAEKAIELINQGLSLDPKNYNGYFQLGNSQILQKDYPKALSSFIKANEIKPDFWQSLNNQGLVLYEVNEIDKAILIWKQVLKIENDAEPMLALATAMYAKNIEIKKSITLAKEALLKNPDYVYEIHQKNQLWGEKLRNATKNLFNDDELKSAIKNAISKSTLKNG